MRSAGGEGKQHPGPEAAATIPSLPSVPRDKSSVGQVPSTGVPAPAHRGWRQPALQVCLQQVVVESRTQQGSSMENPGCYCWWWICSWAPRLWKRLQEGLQNTRWLMGQSRQCQATSQHAGTLQTAACRLLGLFEPAPIKTLKEARKQLKRRKNWYWMGISKVVTKGHSLSSTSLVPRDQCWSSSWKVSPFHNPACSQHKARSPHAHTYCSAQARHRLHSLGKSYFVPAQNLPLGFPGAPRDTLVGQEQKYKEIKLKCRQE